MEDFDKDTFYDTTIRLRPHERSEVTIECSSKGNGLPRFVAGKVNLEKELLRKPGTGVVDIFGDVPLRKCFDNDPRPVLEHT